MKLKSLFILFFSIFLLSLSSEAMATDVTIVINSDCTTKCAEITTCTDITTTHKIKSDLISDFTITCSSIGGTGVTNAVAICKKRCDINKDKLRQGAGYIEDAESNISQNSFTRSACNLLRIVTGGAGKTFATFAVIATGIGFFTGKVSWGLMIGVAAGIATMFGGPSIVSAISGEDTKTMCNIN